MKLRLLLFIFVLSSFSVSAQTGDFAAFLSGMKEVLMPDASVFGPPTWGDHVSLNDFSQYLPKQDSTCRCNEDIVWLGCGYMKMDDYILAFLRRGCGEFSENRFKYWLMEDSGSDKTLAVYSVDGELLDYKAVARDAYCYFDTISYDPRSRSFTVEAGELDEPGNWYRFEDLVYITSTHRYSIAKNGKIKDKVLQKRGKHIVPNERRKYSDVDLSFPQFLSRFHKWEKPWVVNDSIFEQRTRQELPAYFMYKLIPDSVECQCWPTEMWWNAYHYIETSDKYLCFVNEGCSMPTAEEGIFTNYYMLVFAKQGILEQVVKICRSRDEDDFTPEEFNALLTKRLREVLMQME